MKSAASGLRSCDDDFGERVVLSESSSSKKLLVLTIDTSLATYLNLLPFGNKERSKEESILLFFFGTAGPVSLWHLC